MKGLWDFSDVCTFNPGFELLELVSSAKWHPVDLSHDERRYGPVG